MKRGSFEVMKSVNKSIVLNQIRLKEPISRAAIAKLTGLTPPTVSSIVRELIEENLILESTLGESQGGRKPTMLLINKNGFYMIGVDAGPNSIKCILSNLSGEIKDRLGVSMEASLTNDTFLHGLKESIKRLLHRIEDPEKIIGIGVAMHGVVEVETGVSLFAPNLRLKHIPIKEVLEQEFNLPVQVENDARAMALGESWFGDYGTLSSMMAVNIGSGVGAGLVIDGKLYHGASDLAGEVGHMTIDIHGEQCECGNRGCLQTFVSGPAIVSQANKRMPEKHIETSEQVYQLAINQDYACKALLEETGMLIGVGLLNLMHVINPEIIIIGGGVSKAEQLIMPKIKKTITDHGLTKAVRDTLITVSTLGEDATALGAVSLLLVEIFEPK